MHNPARKREQELAARNKRRIASDCASAQATNTAGPKAAKNSRSPSQPREPVTRSGSSLRPKQQDRRRNKPTPAAPDIIESSAEKLIRSVLDGAKKGNPLDLRLAIYGFHRRSERMPIELRLPALHHAKDSAAAHAMMMKAMADGELTPAEASGILSRLNRVVRVMKHCTPDAWHYPFSMERMQQILNPTVKWMIERLSSEW